MTPDRRRLFADLSGTGPEWVVCDRCFAAMVAPTFPNPALRADRPNHDVG